MSRPDRHFDWQEIADDDRGPASIGSRERLGWLLAGFIVASIAVLARAVQLEISQGATFRELAAMPLRRVVELPAARGRIFARDGGVLACDRTVVNLAIHYRHFQEPPDAGFLRTLARQRLPRKE